MSSVSDDASYGSSHAAGLRSIVWNVSVAGLLVGMLFLVFLWSLGEPQRSIGTAASHMLVGISPFLVIALIERLAKPAGPRKSARRWLLHFQIMLVFFGTSILSGIFAAYVQRTAAKFLGINLGIIDLMVPDTAGIIDLIGAVFILLLITDFSFYWYHRCQHISKFLWAYHKMHHMDLEFDAMTGARNTWTESLFGAFLMGLPIAVLFKLNGLDPFGMGVVVGIIIAILKSISLINHSNLRLQFGRAGVLFISPQTHRIHHSILEEHQDRNFAGVFPIWDILFGTYHHPARDEFPLTGVKGEKEIGSVWEAQIFPLREWWKMFCARPGSRVAAAAQPDLPPAA